MKVFFLPIVLTVYLALFLTLDYGSTIGDLHWLLVWIDTFPHGDKFMHFTRSFILAGLVACNARLFFKQLKSFYLILLLCVFVISLEVSQIYIDTRTFSLFDLGIELLGAILGFWLLKVLSENYINSLPQSIKVLER